MLGHTHLCVAILPCVRPYPPCVWSYTPCVKSNIHVGGQTPCGRPKPLCEAMFQVWGYVHGVRPYPWYDVILMMRSYPWWEVMIMVCFWFWGLCWLPLLKCLKMDEPFWWTACANKLYCTSDRSCFNQNDSFYIFNTFKVHLLAGRILWTVLAHISLIKLIVEWMT